MLNTDDLRQSKVYRTSLKAFYHADNFCRKSGRNAKLAVKKHQLRQAKSRFGMDYLTLLEQDAGYEELDQCLREGHMKVGMINKDIQALRAEKKSLDELLKDKLAGVEVKNDPDSRDISPPIQPSQKKDSTKMNSEIVGDEKVNDTQELHANDKTKIVLDDEKVENEDEQEYVVLGPEQTSEEHDDLE